MKSKITEKLFNLAYTDTMTDTYNRNSYEERLKKLRKSRAVLNNITVAVATVTDIKQIKDNYGQHTADEAVCVVANTLKKTIGEKADIFRISEDTFVCIADRDILSYIAQFMDYISFENRDRALKVNAAIGYAVFNSKKHKSIDDLIKYCEQKKCKNRK